MNALANILLTGTFLGVLAVLGTGLLLRAAHSSLRTARARAQLRRQREQVRRDYWGYE